MFKIDWQKNRKRGKNKMASSIKKNLGMQTAFQILNTCLPLITAPYLSRTLGATALGVYSFTSSIVSYFILFAMLGTVNYGTRTIAAAKENKEERSKCFWGIFLFQVIVTVICLLAYIVYMFLICKDNFIIAWIQGITIVCCCFDINWLFFGVENFKITVTRSMIIKIVTVVLILLTVKTTEDLWLYTLIMAMGTLVSQIVLWIYVPQYISFSKISIKDIQKHIKPNIILFIPLLAMSVYHIMDKTMLGILSSYEQNGFYYNADKLINIPLCIINGIGTVMLPRMTALYNSDQNKEANELLIISLEGVGLVSIAMACGIAAISNEFVPFFFGSGYEPCILLTVVLSPVLIIKGFTNTLRTQYLVPLKMEKYYISSVLSGAITNLGCNLLLIPRLGALGAVLGTLVAEFVACVIQFVIIRKNFDFKSCLKSCFVYLCAGLLMVVLVRAVSHISVNIILKILIEIVIGGIIFILVAGIFVYKSRRKVFEEIFSGILRKIK